ncbi:hypothetical protein HYC85_028266 [Camellia sinensis]|uniref:Uncharacterized protein n=1 Tax=Camellia sinensis TaxID=4442 RepID=A0A7J7FUR6_CAMSI|nr:hypothetical protein HYC85_028266 [Camellia sinensis]
MLGVPSRQMLAIETHNWQGSNVLETHTFGETRIVHTRKRDSKIQEGISGLNLVNFQAGTKLDCAVLSLPVPSKSANPCGEQVNNLVSQAVPDYIEQRTPFQKLLLIGYSGSRTIFKQAKILCKYVPLSGDERENIKLLIQSNVYGYLGILLEGRERFEDESLNEARKNQFSDASGSSVSNLLSHRYGNSDVNDGKTMYSICPRLKAFSDWLLKVMASGNLEAIFPAATREYAPLVQELWNRRLTAGEVSWNCYLVLLADDILRLDYEPSDVDIIFAEGYACFWISHFPSEHMSSTLTPPISLILCSGWYLSFMLLPVLEFDVRVQARGFGESCKWLEMLEDVRIVIFCVALITHPTFDQMDFLLILNKFDLFEEMEQIPLTH